MVSRRQLALGSEAIVYIHIVVWWKPVAGLAPIASRAALRPRLLLHLGEEV